MTQHQALLNENFELKNRASVQNEQTRQEIEGLKKLVKAYKTSAMKVTLPDKFNGDFEKLRGFF